MPNSSKIIFIYFISHSPNEKLVVLLFLLAIKDIHTIYFPLALWQVGGLFVLLCYYLIEKLSIHNIYLLLA
jgi:hypothetical protein